MNRKLKEGLRCSPMVSKLTDYKIIYSILTQFRCIFKVVLIYNN
jgi:hypothetical protein